MEEAVENLTLNDLKEKLLLLLDIVKCAVCLESVRQEMVHCVNGHLLCSVCKKDLNKCPTCQAAFSQSKPSHIISQVLEILPPRCKYNNCSTILQHDDDHEKYCGFKTTECKWCDWEGPGKYIWDHVDNDHANVPWQAGKRKHSNFDFGYEFSYYFATKFDENQFFWEETINDPETKMFTKTWHSVPNGKPLKEYFVTLSFRSKSGPFIETKIKLSPDPDEPSEGNSFSVPHRLLHYFIEDGVLCYAVFREVK